MQEGAKVVIADNAATAVAPTINASGGTALSVETDVTDETSIRAAMDMTIKSFERVDILFNCAGGSRGCTGS
ncbi:SDR family NAD(P)-dependent oxidoreductase [Sinorhizobium medicae]|uniref:SDR family NAD(P)-dependent oxidoreductase n=1 Tax=Sinorhizobium medicae TaxID=110321 RepID=UPI000FD867C7|nr:SDR family NAD(P)-dependent oxidoreductase [Sinorhizobium medicae]RVO73540.1 SDR family oxidoreductase [Sinorhizobium medicae]